MFKSPLRRRTARPRKVFVLGLDCASPDLIFDQFRDDLPTLSRLADGGIWGDLESSIPCITVPAWSSMLSGRDPGTLGVYGFRNRADHSYATMTTADSSAIRRPRLWDFASAASKESVILAVPQTYPPTPIKGSMVSCFLTPGPESAFAYPAVLKHEALKLVPDYRFDIPFRTTDKAWLHQDLLDMTDAQFRLAEHMLTSRAWDLFMYVNIGVDRLHHGFWRYHDPQHRLHEPASPFRDAVRDYYRLMDAWTARLIAHLDDQTAILIVSDHGVTRMDGGICVNEWLWRHGWLALKQPPPAGTITRLEDIEVDWDKTRAWASGGYYGRVFLNVQGREPQGCIPAAGYPAARAELAAALAAIPDPSGVPLDTQVFEPETIYQQVNGVAPDLMVYFGDLHWRAVGSLGHGDIYTLENDTGPDDANHHPRGMFIYSEPGTRAQGRVEGRQLMDVAPTLLRAMGLPVPGDLQGHDLVNR